ncbi:hypothetical protein GCM10028793_12760 [Nocardiopsis oceani]
MALGPDRLPHEAPAALRGQEADMSDTPGTRPTGRVSGAREVRDEDAFDVAAVAD